MEETKQEPPILPIGAESSEPGVNIRVNESWQVSVMPEEKQYFSQDVSKLESNTVLASVDIKFLFSQTMPHPLSEYLV